MKITKMIIKNFRLLKNIEIDLEKDLSLIIGKNNCGKTSVLSVLKKFLANQGVSNNFYFDDFNMDLQKKLAESIQENSKEWKNLECKGIELILFIEYNDQDNLSNISSLMLDLDPENKIMVLKMEYVLDDVAFDSLKNSFEESFAKLGENIDQSVFYEKFIHSKFRKFFKFTYSAILYDHHLQKIDPRVYKIIKRTDIDLSKIICLRFIDARRDTANKDNDESLSNLSSKYYETVKANDEDPIIQSFEDSLMVTDLSLTNEYEKIFKDVINKVKKFGGIKKNETVIKLISTLGQQQLLKNNTTMVYQSDAGNLPESFNGLGYLNLISIIFQIETIMAQLRCDNFKDSKPADINLLFIEEPEAHTHPQMQYIFIKNIKNLLLESSSEKGKNIINLQTIITTHSSHIVAESDFNDIKYFKKISSTSVISKNMKDLEAEYRDEKEPENKRFKFLKQYLTLNYSEIFFADKAILYEGDTERILLPAMMKKIDQEDKNKIYLPLLSQNISLLQAGANSQLFDKFIEFIGIKTLIITDIDSAEKTTNADMKVVSKEKDVKNGNVTTNSSLKHYYNKPLKQWKSDGKGNELDFFKNQKMKDKILMNNNGLWIQDPKGKLMVSYQTEEEIENEKYYPRSFEDAFIFCNRDFMEENASEFLSLKNKDEFSELKIGYADKVYDLTKNVKNKPSFAMDVLLYSTSNDHIDFYNWNIPSYIREGLEWLREE